MDPEIKENALVSLHDCRTNRIKWEGQYVTFYIPDGFYTPAHENCRAEMKCRLADTAEDCFSVCVFRKNRFGRTVREDWSDRFVPGINAGAFEFEFVYTYRAYRCILFKGYIWRKKKPWLWECEVEIRTDEITYSWDDPNSPAEE